ncbi:hypothetical protein PQR75_08560 [Paraburkholderia fungorum]
MIVSDLDIAHSTRHRLLVDLKQCGYVRQFCRTSSVRRAGQSM